MGACRSDTLSRRHARLVCRLHGLSCHPSPQQVEGAPAQVGSCRHLLAHSRLLFPSHPCRLASTRLLGLESVHLRMAMCHLRHHSQFSPSQGAQQPRNLLFRGHGLVCSCCLQAPSRQCQHRRRLLDNRRGRCLHHRCCLLQSQQEALHAFRLPFLRPPRQHLPHHRRMGRANGVCEVDTFLLCNKCLKISFTFTYFIYLIV